MSAGDVLRLFWPHRCDFLPSTGWEDSAPDVIFTYGQSTFLNFATQGGLVDLAPSIAKLGEGNNIETYVGDVMNMGNIDGKQYALLSKRGAANPRHTAYIRQDWLDELGLPMPTTKQELIDTLYKFKEAKPDYIPWAMNGRTDTEKTYLNFVGSYVDFADLKDQYCYSEGYICELLAYFGDYFFVSFLCYYFLPF